MVRVFMTLSLIACFFGAFILALVGGVGLFEPNPTYMPWIIAAAVYGSFFVVPFLLCLPVILPLALRNKNIDQIIVFRKFNNKASGKAIRKIIRSYVSNYGHVFTLSDSNFKVKWWIRIPLMLGQTSFFHFRQRNIRDARGLDALGRKLRDKAWLNINWLLSSGKIFSVRTTDEYWHDTATLLLKDSRLVLFDVLTLTRALEWEIEMTKSHGLEQHIILIAPADNAAVVAEWKTKYDTPDDGYEIPVFYYDSTGKLQDSTGLEQAVAEILVKDRGEERFITQRLALRKVFLTAGIVIAGFAAVLFFILPYLAPDLPGKYSPFAWQTIQSYMHARLNREDDAQLAPVRQRILRRWPAQAAGMSIGYAYRHESAECQAVAATLRDLADPSLPKEYIRLIEQGEPTMSEVAYALVDSMHLPGRRELALHWIAQDRLDGKQKGLAWLERDPPDSRDPGRLLSILSDPSYRVGYPPWRHESHTMREGSAPGATFHVDGPEALTRKYYLRLYRLLSSADIDPPHRDSLNRDVRILFSLLLLRAGNGCCPAALFDSYYIDTYYNVRLNPRYDSYLNFFPATVPRPFKELTDSLLLHRHLANMPSFDVLVRSSRLADSTQLPGSFISMLLRSYPSADLAVFDRHMRDKALPLALYDCLHGEDARPRLPLIRSHRQTFESLIKEDTVMSDRLSIAWLLAHVGDPLAAQVATEAAAVVEKKLFIFNNYPYADRAAEIRAVYSRYARQ
jgi:hypothetical protein